MSNITLSAGIRQNLLSLQNTSADLTTTQEHLSTGKKVNTAFDNPSSYFTSQSLTNRSNDLSSLLDQIGQAQQTLDAANNGLTSLTSLLEQALSTAQQAQQAPGAASVTYGTVTVNGSIPSGDQETLGTDTGTVDVSGLSGGTIGTAGNVVVNVGGTSVTATLAASDTLSDVVAAFNTALTGTAVSATTNSGGDVILASSDSSVSFTVNANAESALVGLTADASTAKTNSSTDIYQILHTAGITSGDALTVSVNGGATQDIAFGTGTGQIQTLAQLNTALSGLSGGVTASASGTAVSFNVASTTVQNSLTIGTSGTSGASAILTALGLTAGTSQGTATAGAANATRTTLQGTYNGLLTQIDQLAGDASYNGVNLLNGDNLAVNFNETGTSGLTISGVQFDSTGLGLSAVTGTGFQVDSNIQSTINSINAAITTVRAQTETFGTNSSTITTRQTFEQNMINTLQTGASNLVLADQNQESANLLTLQTQQQLEISALSIANQANQSVLKLFG
jgi:flagellin-like hook-associated protein FlgL